MRAFEPQVVVTYDENGFYGHPDHIQANRVTQAAIEESGVPAKLYYTAVARSLIRGFGEILEEAGIEVPAEVEENPDFGTPGRADHDDGRLQRRRRAQVRVARRAREPERQHLLPADGRGAVLHPHGIGELRAGSRLHARAVARGRPVRRASLRQESEPGLRPTGRRDAGPGPVGSLRRGAGRGSAGASVGDRSDEAQRRRGDQHGGGE